MKQVYLILFFLFTGSIFSFPISHAPIPLACKNMLQKRAADFRLCSPCSPTGPIASLCNLNVTNQLCASGISTNQLCVSGNTQINGNLIVSGGISGVLINDPDGYGNVCRVDQVYGNDETGARNGAPFLTIQAALNASLPGDVVWIFPGTYNEVLVVPPGVSVSSIARGSVIIQQLGITTPTDLVTLSDGAYLQNVILLMQSSEHVQMRGIVHAGEFVPSATTTIDNVAIIIENTATTPGSSDTYGIVMTGTGSVGFRGDFIIGGIINIISFDTGKKRGIYIDSPTLTEILLPIVQMIGGGPDTIAIETNNPACVVATQGGSFGGDPTLMTPDISQTQGTLDLDTTYLGNSNANELGFSDLTFPTTLIWADPDSPIGGGFTLYMRPGTFNASITPVFLNAFQKFVAREMSVRVETPPGPGQSTTWTLQRQQPTDLAPVDTIMTVTLSGTQTVAELEDISVHFSEGDLISMKMVTSAGAQTGDAVVQVAIY